MKYFEIPACGTLLLGEPTNELASIGFNDGNNFVEVNKDSFSEKIGYYLKWPGKNDVNEIACNGRKLICEKHSWKIRIKELFNNIRKVLHGNE